jgi:AcrR family transcriptional regulator
MSLLILVVLAYNFRIGGDIIFTGRFLFPLLPLIYLLIQELFRTVLRASDGRYLRTVARWSFTAAVLIAYLAGATREWNVLGKEVEQSRSANNFARTYARCIREHTRPDDTIAVVSAGILPYYADRPAIDMLGLNDRYIARHGILDRNCFIGHQKTDTDYILDRAPRVIVLPPKHCFSNLVAAEKHMLGNPRFRQLYEPTIFDCGGYSLHLFVRKDVPLGR